MPAALARSSSPRSAFADSATIGSRSVGSSSARIAAVSA